jgi:hypothetical protein
LTAIHHHLIDSFEMNKLGSDFVDSLILLEMVVKPEQVIELVVLNFG